jgi:hypothetical protein
LLASERRGLMRGPAALAVATGQKVDPAVMAAASARSRPTSSVNNSRT